MPTIRIDQFKGVVPRLSRRALPDGYARVASNCTLISGDLTPMRKPKFSYAPALATELKSLFRVDESTWFCWPTALVKMARVQLDSEGRYCYTGDGVPKITTKVLGAPVNASGTPAQSRSLGIPSPIASAAVVPTGGTGANVSRFYVYTFYSDWNEESSPSPAAALVVGKVDSTWALSGMDSLPPNTGAVTAVSKTSSTVTLTLGAGNHYLRVADRITVGGITGMTDLNGAWEVLSVPAANQITIALATSQSYVSGGNWNRSSPWGACKKRIYRTSSGKKSDFQLVAIDVVGTSYSDTLTDLQIPGDSLITDGWVPPPVNMTGLVALTNGVLAGYYDNIVCMSEPYQPHAWPTAYRKKMSSQIVGLAAFDTNIGVATKGNPVVLTGADPAQMFPQKHNEPLPGTSSESVCGVGDGVVFATKNGLAKMTISGAKLITNELFGPEEWNSLGPEGMRCIYDGTRIYMVTTAGVIYIFDMSDSISMVTTKQDIDALHVDELTGGLYFSFNEKVYLFLPYTTSPQMIDWWSREYVIPSPMNFGVVMVETDADYSADAAMSIANDQALVVSGNAAKISTIGGRGSFASKGINVRSINSSILDPIFESITSVSVSFYAKEKLIFSMTVPSGCPVRLPSGYKSDTFSLRIRANTRVKSIIIADTPENLRNA